MGVWVYSNIFHIIYAVVSSFFISNKLLVLYENFDKAELKNLSNLYLSKI